MRLIKTNQTERTTYTYTFIDTDESGKQFIHRQTLRPGEDRVTELDIKKLHSMDDHEIYNNIKNIRPGMTDGEKAEQTTWIEKFKSDFFTKNGYEPTKDDIRAAVSERYPKKWVLSLDLFDSDDDGGDTADHHSDFIDYSAVVDEADKLPADVQRMREIVANCTKKQQEAYRLVYIEGYTEEETAKILGCTQQAVNDRISRVIEKIRKNF